MRFVITSGRRTTWGKRWEVSIQKGFALILECFGEFRWGRHFGLQLGLSKEQLCFNTFRLENFWTDLKDTLHKGLPIPVLCVHEWQTGYLRQPWVGFVVKLYKTNAIQTDINRYSKRDCFESKGLNHSNQLQWL